MLDRGLVLMSDTRTNSGVDNVSVFRKMFHWSLPGERVVGDDDRGQPRHHAGVVSKLEERSKAPADRHNTRARSADHVPGRDDRRQAAARDDPGTRRGQRHAPRRRRSPPRSSLPARSRAWSRAIFLIYPEGNFIEAQPDTPFFQIGETKYGRPIIIRAYDPCDELRRRGQAADGQLRFDDQGEPLGRACRSICW